MKPFLYERPRTIREAAEMARAPDAVIYAGGTTMLDLMKLGAYRPARVVDITFLDAPAMRRITVDGGTLRLGALVTMHEAAENADVKRLASVMSESLWLAASQQLRHMATLGGNVLQRTRDPYFRDPSWVELAGGLGGTARDEGVDGTGATGITAAATSRPTATVA